MLHGWKNLWLACHLALYKSFCWATTKCDSFSLVQLAVKEG